VSVTELLEDPERFAGYRVKVTGYMIEEFEVQALFSDARSAAKRSNVPEAIWVDVPYEASRRGVVTVVGTFVHDPHFGEGHLDMYPSAIADVKWFSRGNEPAK
jgi:hypothetical protein